MKFLNKIRNAIKLYCFKGIIGSEEGNRNLFYKLERKGNKLTIPTLRKVTKQT